MATLSQKELLYLQDCLNAEMLEIKKFGECSQRVTDPSLKQLCIDIQKTHQKHYDMLMKHLGGGPLM